MDIISKVRRTFESMDEAAGSLTSFQLAAILALVALIAIGGLYSMFRSRPTAIGVVGGKDKELSAKNEQAITVHVSGSVACPGLYRLSEGSRVADALEKAGGPLPDAALDELNLAARATDGMKITVTKLAPDQGSNTEPSAGAPHGMVNLNTASAAELEELPGVGPQLAERIVDYRRSKGQFGKVEELDNVEGIGPGKLENLKGLVTI